MASGHGLGDSNSVKRLLGLRSFHSSSIGSAQQSKWSSGDRGSKSLPGAATSFYGVKGGVEVTRTKPRVFRSSVLWQIIFGLRQIIFGPKKYQPSMERMNSSAGDHAQFSAVPTNESRTMGDKGAFPDEAELRRVFERLDENNDGAISSDELRRFVENLGFDMSTEEVQSLLKTVDENGDGMVNFEEFYSLYPRPGTDSEQVQNEKSQEEDLMNAFRVYDKDGDGFIDARELRSVLMSLKIKEGASLQKCKQMIKTVDVDGNGKVDFQEFKKLMSSDTL